jgi:hypothetical protein
MKPQAASAPAEPADAAGMSQDAASYAVMGIDIETLALAVVRQWGLNEDVLHMVRRLPLDRPVRAADSDADLLRATSSCGNEIAEAASRLAPAQLATALGGIAGRYHRLLGVSARDLTDALLDARDMAASGASPGRESASVRSPTNEPPATPATPATPSAPARPEASAATPPPSHGAATPAAPVSTGNGERPLSALRSRAAAATSSNLRQP